MKYEDVVSIGARPHTVWVVEFPNGSRYIEIWHDKARLEDVLSSCQRRYKGKWKLGILGVGAYRLGQVVGQAYVDDSRMVDERGEIV